MSYIYQVGKSNKNIFPIIENVIVANHVKCNVANVPASELIEPLQIICKQHNIPMKFSVCEDHQVFAIQYRGIDFSYAMKMLEQSVCYN